MNIAVCDDQQNALEHTITSIMKVCPKSQIVPFHNIQTLFVRIKGGVKFDVIFMDIEWEGEQKIGIDFAAELYRLSQKSKIIFITGYPERYSQQIFFQNTNLRGFISKPIDLGVLQKNIDKIKDEIALEENRKLILKFNGIVTSIDPDDIIYIESRAHVATIYSINGKNLCYEKLNDLVKRLPRQFISTHKSFLVNMDKIQRIERECVRLESEAQIPISKARHNEVRECYFSYIGLNI